MSDLENRKASFEEYLKEKGLTDEEISGLMEEFTEDAAEEEIEIECIFESTEELGKYYVNNVIGSIDPYIAAVLNYSNLGDFLVDCKVEYYKLNSGRILEIDI